MSVIGYIKRSPFLRNFSLLTAGDLATRFISIFTNILVARYLAPERFGEYTLVTTYGAILYSIASLGVNQLTTRYVARNQDNSAFYFRLSMLVRIIGFALTSIGFYIYSLYSKEDFSSFIIIIILATVFLETLWGGFQNVAFGMQRMEWNAIISVASTILYLVILLVLPKDSYTVIAILLIYVLLYFVKDVAYYFCLKKSNLLTINKQSNDCISKAWVRSFIVDSFPFYILTVLGLFTNQFPTIFLNNNSGAEDVAFFSTANKLVLPISMFVSTALSALFPNQSKLYVEDRERFGRQTVKILVLMNGLGLFLAFCISLFRKEFVWVLYGDAYQGTADVMAFQCWYMVMYTIFCFNGSTLGAADSQRKLAVCSIVYALISTPILFITSKYGAKGLAIGYVIASIFNLCYIFPVLRRVLSTAMSKRFMFCCVAMIMVIMLISLCIPMSLHILFRIAILCAILIALFFYKDRIISYVKN